jgi:spore coat polysaccharide biosynthesis predicted glycosyltransferase SpsG
MSEELLLVAEVGHQVGWGHLAEMRAVASALTERGRSAARVAVGDVAIGDADVDWVGDYGALMQRVVASQPRVIGWNMRTDGWRAAWHVLDGCRARHLWIDDIDNDYPEVDVLVVPRLGPPRHVLPSGPRVFGGSAYFPLDVRGSRAIPPLRGRPREVLLTLGGSDPSEASLRLAPILAGTRSTVVIGPGFRHGDALLRVAADAALEVAVRPAGLRDLLMMHQLVISAGGDTLFEAAAAGTPALVAWTNPSEEAQGMAFAAKGTARVFGRGADVDVEAMAREVARLLASDDLDAMSAAGPGTVDCRGADRIADLLIELVEADAA